jgi:hypothetical protein
LLVRTIDSAAFRFPPCGVLDRMRADDKPSPAGPRTVHTWKVIRSGDRPCLENRWPPPQGVRFDYAAFRHSWRD